MIGPPPSPIAGALPAMSVSWSPIVRCTARVPALARGRLHREVLALGQRRVERAAGHLERARRGVERGLRDLRVVSRRCLTGEHLGEDRARTLEAGRLRVGQVVRGGVERRLLGDGTAQRD
ncbi:MAG: hypothetical protein U0235_14945 [Polyangiaceae bacterium]